jgi:hypothetical protein
MVKTVLVVAALLAGGADLAIVSYRAGHPAPAAVAVVAPVPAPVKGRGFYLAELRNRMPVSVSGDTETLIAQGVCQQLAAGTPRAALVNDLNAMTAPMFGVNGYYYAVAMVDTARENYCV